MRWLMNAFHRLAAWGREDLMAAGTPALLEHEWPTGDIESDDEADREAWEAERARLALSPWWL